MLCFLIKSTYLIALLSSLLTLLFARVSRRFEAFRVSRFVPPRETSTAAKSEEKRMFSPARRVSAILVVHDLRSRIFGTFFVKFLACLPLLGFSNI